MNTTLLYRLAWKEYRTLRALWLSLLVAAFFLMLLCNVLIETPQGRSASALSIILYLPVVYCLACAALAFAGEREEGTDQFLSRLAVPPLALLGVKLAIAVLSTATMFGLLWPLAWLSGAWQYHWRQPISDGSLASMELLALVWGVGLFSWGVVCSLLFRRVLTCLIVAMVATTLTPTLVAELTNLLPSRLAQSDALDWTLRLGALPALLLLASVWLVGRWDEDRWPRAIEWLGRFGHRLHRLRVRVVNMDNAANAEPTQLATPKPTLFLPDVLRTKIGSWAGFVSIVHAMLRRVGLCWSDTWLPAWRREVRRLLWLEWRSVWSVSLGLIVAGSLGMLALAHTADSSSDRRFMLAALPLILGFVAFALGIWSFHGQQREQRFRFFAAQGASPAIMWLVKHVVWLSAAWFSVVLLLIVASLISDRAINRDEFSAAGLQNVVEAIFRDASQHVWWQMDRPDWPSRLLFCLMKTTQTRPTELYRLDEVFDVWRLVSLVFLAIGRGVLAAWLCFAVGQLASLLIPRAVTAMVVGFLGLLIVFGWWFVISQFRVPLLITIWPVLLGLIATAWGRMSDWLEQRSGWRRWLRVATTALLPMFAAFVGMATYRVYEVPFVRLPWQPLPISAEARQTGEDWRRLAERLESPFDRRDAQRNPVDPNLPQVQNENLNVIKPAHWNGFAERDWLTNNAALLDEALQLANRPDCSLPESWYWTELTQKQLGRVALLLKMSAFESLANHRLDEALQRALALYRFGQQLGRHSDGGDRWRLAVDVQVAAIQVLREWALSPDQTEASLLTALGRSDADPPHPVAQFVRAERSFAADLSEVLRSDYAYSVKVLEKYWNSETLRPRWAFWDKIREQRLLKVLAMEGQSNLRAAMTSFVRYNPRHPSVRYERLFLTTEAERFAYRQGPTSPGERWQETTARVWHGASWNQGMVANHFVPVFGTLETHRRGLWLTLALQAHRLKHGRLPDRLDELVGPYLDRLPSDPISGLAFEYFPNGIPVRIPSDGRVLADRTPLLTAPGQVAARREPVTVDYWTRLGGNRRSVEAENIVSIDGVTWVSVLAQPFPYGKTITPYNSIVAVFSLTSSF